MTTLARHALTIADSMDPIGNHQGRPETKRHQAAELLHRAFAELRGCAGRCLTSLTTTIAFTLNGEAMRCACRCAARISPI